MLLFLQDERLKFDATKLFCICFGIECCVGDNIQCCVIYCLHGSSGVMLLKGITVQLLLV